MLNPARCLLLFVVICPLAQAESGMREWTDSSGKHRVQAELIGVEGGTVHLRREDGKEISLPLKRLSVDDRRLLAELKDPPAQPLGEGDQVLAGYAEEFFGDLRTKSRRKAMALLTEKSQALEKRSPVYMLPTPDKGLRAIRVGTPSIEGDSATAPVTVRVDKQAVETVLHFTREQGEWRVAGLSAMRSDGELRLNFDIGRKPNNKEILQALVGKPLPIVGITQDGQPFSSEAYRGKVVLVDFWATWCGPCRKEIPNIQKTYEEHHDEGFEVIAVSLDRDIDKLAEFVTAEPPPWAVLADYHPENPRRMGSHYRIRSVPSLVLVGRDGRVTSVDCRGKKLEPAVKKALRKRSPSRTVASR